MRRSRVRGEGGGRRRDLKYITHDGGHILTSKRREVTSRKKNVRKEGAKKVQMKRGKTAVEPSGQTGHASYMNE